MLEEAIFDNERELEKWVKDNVNLFFGDVVFIDGFRITTSGGKAGVPDGFFVDVENSTWGIIECELLRHGVWEHIAEQIVRFIVALRNDATKKKVRDKTMEKAEEEGKLKNISDQLGIPAHRILLSLEGIIEANPPEIAIFIDNINDDLEDLSNSLIAPMKIYKVRKFQTDAGAEYDSPDVEKPSFETTIEDVQEYTSKKSLALDTLGGGRLFSSVQRVQIFELEKGGKVAIRFSKYHEKPGGYWYGITPSTVQKYRENNLGAVVFILGTEGLIELPMPLLEEYLPEALTSNKLDGTVKHYHLYFEGQPEPILYVNKVDKIWECKDYFMPFES